MARLIYDVPISEVPCTRYMIIFVFLLVALGILLEWYWYDICDVLPYFYYNLRIENFDTRLCDFFFQKWLLMTVLI